MPVLLAGLRDSILNLPRGYTGQLDLNYSNGYDMTLLESSPSLQHLIGCDVRNTTTGRVGTLMAIDGQHPYMHAHVAVGAIVETWPQSAVVLVVIKPFGVIVDMPTESVNAKSVPGLGDLVVDIKTGIVGAVVDMHNDAARLSNTHSTDGLSKLSNLRRLDLFNGCNVSSRGTGRSGVFLSVTAHKTARVQVAGVVEEWRVPDLDFPGYVLQRMHDGEVPAPPQSPTETKSEGATMPTPEIKATILPEIGRAHV